MQGGVLIKVLWRGGLDKKEELAGNKKNMKHETETNKTSKQTDRLGTQEEKEGEVWDQGRGNM